MQRNPNQRGGAGMGVPGDDIESVLRQLRGKNYFVKTMTATNVPIKYENDSVYCQLILPTSFIKEHGDKLQKNLTLESAQTGERWPARLFISYRQSGKPAVVFGGGWKTFATITGLKQGDRLIFHLRAMSEFVVFMFHESGDPKRLPPSAPPTAHSSRASKSAASSSAAQRRKPTKLHRSRKKNKHAPYTGLNSQVAKRRANKNLFAGPTNPGNPTASDSNSNLHEMLPLMSSSHSSGVGEEADCLRPSKLFPESSPSFVKRLLGCNFHNSKGYPNGTLEIPKKFMRDYCHQLQSREIKLQGIRDESQVWIASRVQYGQQVGRLRSYIANEGWNDFLIKNSLQIGDELVFTLVDNSFFVIRKKH